MNGEYPTITIHDEPVYRAMYLILEEVETARARCQPVRSADEGLAMVTRYFEELKAEVLLSPVRPDIHRMYQQSIQLAAMAARYMIDVCDEEVALHGQ